MIQAAKKTRSSIAFSGVFQYHRSGSCEVEDLRTYVIEKLYEVLRTGLPLQKPEFKRHLIYGNYNLGGDKDVPTSLRELIWKHSELTGKYCGCQYWSAKAKSLLEKELREHMNGAAPTLEDAMQIVAALKKQTRDEVLKISHEHIYPIANLVDDLQHIDPVPSLEEIRAIIEKRAIGCVVLESEHRLLEPRIGHPDNPWLRYQGIVVLADNPNWPPFQRQLIEKAKLLESRI